MVAELAQRAHGGNVSAYLRQMIEQAHRGVWPPANTPRIIEELYGHLHGSDQPHMIAELERLGLRDDQKRVLDRLLGALLAHLGELPTGADTSHLTRLGVYVCRARDFFSGHGGRVHAVAEDPPPPAPGAAVIEPTPPEAQKGHMARPARLIRD